MNAVPGTEAQRPAAPMGPALHEPFVPYPGPPEGVADTPFGWPRQIHAFRFATFGDFVGAYLAPSHWVSREYVPPEVRTRPPDGLGETPLAVSALADGEALFRLLKWGSVPGPDGQSLAPSLAWVTRVLSVLYWVACPREGVGREEVPLPMMGARVRASFLVCPGGNLHALMVLAWRAVRDAAAALVVALEQDPDPGEVYETRYPPLVRSALGGLGPIPGYPLRFWSGVREANELLLRYPSFQWGQKSPASMAQRAVMRLETLRDRLTSPSSHRRYRFESFRKFRTFDSRLNWDQTIGHNLAVYGVVCSRVLAETVIAVRVLGHVVHLLRVLHGYGSDPVRHRPKRWVSVLRHLAEAEISVLDTFFEDVVRASRIPAPWLWHAEHELEYLVVRLAPIALARVWGIPYNEPDSLDRAGASCPCNGRYFAPRGPAVA